MDDERFAATARGADVSPESFALPLQVAGQTIIIKTGLAHGDDFRVRGEPDQILDTRLGGVFIVRMDSDRRNDVGMLLGNAEHARKFGQIDADA